MKFQTLFTIAVLFAGFFSLLNAEKSIAVLNLQSEQLKPTDCIAVTNYLTTELQKISGYRILAWDDVTKMLEHQAGTQSLGCEDDKCLAEVGGALGVDYILAGDIGQIGDRFLMNLKLINISRASTEKRSSTIVEGNIGLLMDRLPLMVGEILGSDELDAGPVEKVAPEKVAPEKVEKPAVVAETPQQTIHSEKKETRTKRTPRFTMSGAYSSFIGWYNIHDARVGRAEDGFAFPTHGGTLAAGIKFTHSRLNVEFSYTGGEWDDPWLSTAYQSHHIKSSTSGLGVIWFMERWRIADILTIAPAIGAGFWTTWDDFYGDTDSPSEEMENNQFGALYLRVKLGKSGKEFFFDIGQIIGTESEMTLKDHDGTALFDFWRIHPIMHLRAGFEYTFGK